MKLRNIVIILMMILVIMLIAGAPLIVINNIYLKTMTINILGNKENAYQYMQFLAVFLGTIITVVGAIITVRYQIYKEIKVQKYIERQSFIRNEISQQIIKMKMNLKDLRAEISSVKNAANWAINYEDKEMFKGMDNDSNRIDVKNNFNNKYNIYSRERIILEILLENYVVELDNFSSEFSKLKQNISMLNEKTLDIGMRVSAFPQYTIEMMEYLVKETNNSYILCDYIYELLDKLYKELNRYYVEEF